MDKNCSNLYKSERKEYYEALVTSNLTDNKKFWKTIRQLFSDKSKGSANITLVKNDKLVTSEIDVAQTLNHHFIDSVKRLVDGDTSSSYLTEQSNICHPTANIIHKFRNHPSIISIQRNAISKLLV